MIENTHNKLNLSFGTYTDQILGLANQTFSTLHARFLKEIWNNNISAKLHHNHAYTDWQNGTYECYIPVRDNNEYNLTFMRIAIQVLPYNSNQYKRKDSAKLMNRLQEPHGDIDSELLILIAPQQDKWGLVRAFKHRNKPGYFTAVFTNKSPEIVWKRVLDHIHNFISKRLEGLMKAMTLEDWVWRWLVNKESKSLLYVVIENFSYVLRQSCLTFMELIWHFKRQIKLVLGDIGAANMALHRTCREIREEIKVLQKALIVRARCEASKDVVLLLKRYGYG